MTINVVAALQSPTLLNILASSDAWSMKVCAMGDHENLAEASELTAPMWNGAVDPVPDVVLVCSPAHRDFASRVWPSARVLWVIHNGYERGLLPPEHEMGVAGAVCFSEKVRWICQAGRSVKVHFVSPAYEANPVWEWAPNKLWTLRNRPDTRRDDIDAIIAAVVNGQQHTYYGQGQPGGFAGAEKKAELRASSSAYVSCMMRGSGFGLAEHEAFAAGVPVIGGWWGDTDEELGEFYWSLTTNLQDLAEVACHLATNPDGAKGLSLRGLDYIRKYRTKARMDDTIGEMLRQVG